MLFLSFYTIGLVLLAVWGFCRAKQASSAGFWQRFLKGFFPVSVWNTAFLFLLKIREAYFYDTNWERLQNVFALSIGDKVYHPIESGPILNSMYGPASIFAFWPAAWGQTPASVMTIAASLAVFYFFAPIAYLNFSGASRVNVSEKKDRMSAALFGFLFFAGIALLSSSLRNAGFRIHADAPAFGFGALACAALAVRRPGGRGLSAAALLAVLAVWSKQVMVPVIAACAVYVWITEGFKTLRHFVLLVFVWGVLVSAFFIYLFGYEPLFINMFYIPGRQPLRDGWFFDSLLKLGRECLIPLAAAAAFAGLFLKLPWKQPARLVRENRWTLFLIAALFLIPTSILGNGKVGGSNNTLSYTVYFLLAAFTFASADSPGFRWRSAALMLMVLFFIQVPSVYHRYRKLKKEKDYPQVVYNYARKYPGKAYFPRFNTLTMMAEKKVYHGSCGLIDREWARIAVKPEHFRAHVPDKMELLAFREGGSDDKQYIALPEFWFISSDPELPGFRVYLKEKK